MEDSQEKILKDWNESRDDKALNYNPIFKTFDELYRYLKLFAEYQGGDERFKIHPYDNFEHYAKNKFKYNKVQRRLWEKQNDKDKRKEKGKVTQRIEFWKRIKEYKKHLKDKKLRP